MRVGPSVSGDAGPRTVWIVGAAGAARTALSARRLLPTTAVTAVLTKARLVKSTAPPAFMNSGVAALRGCSHSRAEALPHVRVLTQSRRVPRDRTCGAALQGC